MKHLSLLLILMVMALNGAFAQKKIKTINSWNKNQVIAHRGAWKKTGLPENSIASLKQAVKIGCFGSEFDVHMTADSVLVVNHDPDFQGMHIEKSTYKELLSKKHSNGESIPTLEAYLKAGMKQKTTRLILEIKMSKAGAESDKILTAKVVDMVHRLKATPWVDYISFSYDVLKQVLQLQPGAHVAYLKGDVSLEQMKQDGFYGADYHYSVYQKGEWFSKAKELGLTINAWTVNTEPEMKWLLDNKVEFITTNEPELLFEVIKNHK
jgi:glycerophosphoryl diester phosphodiesterase